MQQFNVGDKVEFTMAGGELYTGTVVEIQSDDMYLVSLDQQDFQISMYVARLSLVQ